jgi:hypothetical protein
LCSSDKRDISEKTLVNIMIIGSVNTRYLWSSEASKQAFENNMAKFILFGKNFSKVDEKTLV